MKLNKRTYRNNSLRLQGYDYSNEGIYFVTILTKNREPFFGKIIKDQVVLNEIGDIAEKEWLKTQQIRDRVTLGQFVIMPDHLHAILALGPVRAHGHAPLLAGEPYKNEFGPQRNNLSSIIRGFKGSSTKKIRQTINPSFAWHRSFYDRVIRNKKELNKIEEYIFNNPIAFYLKQKDSGFELNF
ncbi:MAG TPA: transposase [Gracilimonas sp.]|uniref:transposase n=1 Tax=Gracilimonas sp. TaxID=1974203 RepID=UPI002DAECA99|nr:transposase [Gracilimonas sp.]